jgi:hypothetical protein
MFKRGKSCEGTILQGRTQVMLKGHTQVTLQGYTQGKLRGRCYGQQRKAGEEGNELHGWQREEE